MFAFAFRMIRDKFKSFITYSIAAVGFLEMYIALYPAIKEQSGQIDQLVQAMPAGLFEALNMDISTFSFSNFQSYMSTEYLSFLWPIMAIVFVISIANYISVSEVDKGTIENLIALPASRVRIFMERYLAGLLLIIGFTAISFLGAIPLASMHGVDFISANFVTATIGSFLFIWAVYSLAVLMSVLMSEKGKASMLTGGVLILMYVINIISSLKDSLSDLKFFSFFHYFNGADLMANNIYTEYSVVVLAGFSIVALIGALFWFRYRDLSV